MPALIKWCGVEVWSLSFLSLLGSSTIWKPWDMMKLDWQTAGLPEPSCRPWGTCRFTWSGSFVCIRMWVVFPHRDLLWIVSSSMTFWAPCFTIIRGRKGEVGALILAFISHLVSPCLGIWNLSDDCHASKSFHSPVSIPGGEVIQAISQAGYDWNTY